MSLSGGQDFRGRCVLAGGLRNRSPREAEPSCRQQHRPALVPVTLADGANFFQ
jgi:hypothetical protein